MSVARHTFYNLAGSIVPIGVTLVTVPLYLNAIGLERYGVLALAWVLAGYFAFFDFGIGRATARKMATMADAGPEARNRLFWTSAAITGGMAVLATLAFWPAAHLFIARMHIPAALRPELVEALPLLVAAVPIGIIQSLLGGALDGRRAFGVANAISVIGNLLTAVLPLASAWVFGPRLVLLIAATLVARVGVMVAQFAACQKVVPLGKPEKDGRAEMADLAKFGGWATVTGIAGPVLVYFDRFAIGAWLGAAAVGFYVIGYNLISQIQVVPGAFSRALFPRLAELGPEESHERTKDAVHAMAALVTPMTVAVILTMTPFLHLWLGPEVSTASGPVAVILLLGFWVNALAFIAFARLQAIGRPDLAAKVHVSELLPYAILLYIGITVAGLKGAATAWSMRCAIDLLLLAYLARLTNALRRTFLFGALLVGGATTLALTVGDRLTYWPLGLIVLALSIVWAWLILPEHLRTSVVAAARHPLRIREIKL